MMGVTSRVGVAPTAPQRLSKTRSAPQEQRIRRMRIWNPNRTNRSSRMWTQGSSRGSSMRWCRLLKRLPIRIPCRP